MLKKRGGDFCSHKRESGIYITLKCCLLDQPGGTEVYGLS